MKRLILTLGALVALAVPSIALAAPPPPTPISGHLEGAVLTAGNYVVPTGQTAYLGWADVKGNLVINGSVINYGMTTFEKNVSVVGGQFKAGNWGVTIDGNMSFLNPAANSDNGFWGDYSPNLIKGNLSYIINGASSGGAYLDFQGPTTVDGNFTYSAGSVLAGMPLALGNTTILP